MSRPALAVAAPLALVAAIVAAGFWGFTYDDGYITYRYADRFASGRGLTWNDDGRVLGTSAPGYAAVLGLAARCGAPIGLAVPDVGSLLFFAGLVTLAALLASAAPGGIGVPLLYGGLALVSRFDLELAGTESVPALVGVVLALRLACVDERPAAAGLAAAGAVAMRADAGLALAVLALASWRRSGAFPARLAAVAAVPLAAGLTALQLYYGTLLPSTLAGKRSELALASSSYGRAQWDWLERAHGGAGAVALIALAAVGLLLGARRLGRARPALGVAALWLLAHEVFYRAVGVPFSPWYHVGTYHALLAGAALGAWELADRLLAPRGDRWLAPLGHRLLAPLAGTGGAARGALALLLLLPVYLPASTFVVAGWGEPPDPRVRLYRDVARAADACPGEGALVAVEIGALGYHSRRPVIDLVGLVDPELLRAKRAGGLAAAALRRHPDFVVDHPVFADPYLGPLLDAARSEGAFRPLGTFARPEYPTRVRLWARAGACGADPRPAP